MKPVISVCIPTYNRCNLLRDTISKILKGFNGENEELEIVVSDNASTDDTEFVCSSFNDSRIKYFKNNENIGGSRNLQAALDRGTGKWLCVISDEDPVVFDKNVVDELTRLEGVVTVFEKGCSEFSGTTESLSEIIDFRVILFRHMYMSGIIYNGDLYHQLSKQYPDFSMHDSAYPHEFIIYKLSSYGKYAFINRKVVLFEGGKAPATYDSEEKEYSYGGFYGLQESFCQRSLYLNDGTVSHDEAINLLMEEYHHKITAALMVRKRLKKGFALKNAFIFESKCREFLKENDIFLDIQKATFRKETFLALCKVYVSNLYGTKIYTVLKKAELSIRRNEYSKISKK